MRPRFTIIKGGERDKLISLMSQQFGITHIDGTLLTLGHDKVRLFTGNITPEDLENLGSTVHIEISGFYLFSIEKDGIRLSHDATGILRSQITKSIIDIDSKQELEWLRGHDVLLTKDQEKIYSGMKGFFVVRSGQEFIGCGKLGLDGRIRNFVPKERRLKVNS
jgi:NOL1/NOP2/fmu family ribosome biogenesis protein